MNKSRSKWWVVIAVLLLVVPAAMAVADAFLTSHPALLAATTPAPSTGFQWRPFLAPFHSVLLHYPIGFVSLAYLLDLIYLRRKNPELRKILAFIMMLSALSAVVVAGLGLLRGSGGGYDEKTLSMHRTFGVSVAVLTMITWGAQWLCFHHEDKLSLSILYRVLFSGTLVSLVIAGHQGGNLTHGSNYLIQNAPDFVKDLLKETETPNPSHEAIANPGVKFYQDKVLPILEARCYECHGPEKQKSSYRLDKKDIALKGGESGLTAIKAKDPLGSNLVRLILMLRDEDDVMPPAGKSALTPEETMTIVQWIQLGAPFPEQAGAAPETVTATNDSAVGSKPETTSVTAAANTEAGTSNGGKIDFATQIKPILEQNCLSCHGAEKQKGKLRLDTLESVLKGGSDDGPAVVPGNADKSPIIRRISIAAKEDKNDEMMPPAKKGGPLSADKIALLKQWVNEGAVWPGQLMLQTVNAAK